MVRTQNIIKAVEVFQKGALSFAYFINVLVTAVNSVKILIRKNRERAHFSKLNGICKIQGASAFPKVKLLFTDVLDLKDLKIKQNAYMSWGRTACLGRHIKKFTLKIRKIGINYRRSLCICSYIA